MSSAENLSPVPSPSILKNGEAGGSPVPTFAEAGEKPKRRKASKRKGSKRKASRKPVESAAEEAPRPRRKASKRKAARRKARKSVRRSAGRRPAAAATSDPSIEAVLTAKRAELQGLAKQTKQVEKQIGMLEKML